MKKPLQLFSWVAFAAVIAGALFYGLSGNNSGETHPEAAASADPQPVTILKYSDYQCPACKLYIPLQEQLKQEFGDLVTIEYRHFPLTGHSQLASRAAEAARKQDRYREMHDRIFEGQEQWNATNAESTFISYAEEIGLDMEQFEADLYSEEVQDIVRRQRSEGERRMVRATPTFYINGQMLRQNPQSYDQFRSIVEMYLYR